MKTVLQLAAVLALVTFSVGTALLSHDLRRLVRDSDAAVLHADAAVSHFSSSIEGEKAELDSILKSAELAASEQRAYWQKTSADSDKTVKALRLVVDRAGLLMKHTDEQLNSSLLPDIDRELVSTSRAAQTSITSVGQVADTLTLKLNDLPMSDIAAHLDEATLHIEGTALALQHTSESGEHVAKYYEKKLTTPASFAQRLAMGALSIGSQLGSVFAGFVK
jgi:hypothetical protein